MGRSEAIARPRRHKAELQRLGVRRLYLLGSTARDAAHEASDVDLFFNYDLCFDYDKGRFGPHELMDVKEAANRILGCETDIMTRG